MYLERPNAETAGWRAKMFSSFRSCLAIWPDLAPCLYYVLQPPSGLRAGYRPCIPARDSRTRSRQNCRISHDLAAMEVQCEVAEKALELLKAALSTWCWIRSSWLLTGRPPSTLRRYWRRKGTESSSTGDLDREKAKRRDVDEICGNAHEYFLIAI